MNRQNFIKLFGVAIGKFKFYLAAFAIITFSAAAQAPLDVRVALVIGNSKYVNAPELVNPGNDARSISLILKMLGFEVINVNDGTKEEILSAVKKSQALLKGRNAVGMLYYAGHGLQLNWRITSFLLKFKLVKV